MKVNPLDFYKYVTSKGVPHAHALGMMANIQDESAWNAAVNERNPTVKGSRGGYGLFQHTGPRRTGLEGYAAKQGRPVSDWRVQVDYALSEPDTKSYLAQNFGDGTEAGNWFLNKWERPAKKNRPARMKDMPTKVSHYGSLVSGEMPATTPDALPQANDNQGLAALTKRARASAAPAVDTAQTKPRTELAPMEAPQTRGLAISDPVYGADGKQLRLPPSPQEAPTRSTPAPQQGLARAPARAKDLGPQVAENTRKKPPG
ncbi:MAG: phage tail tip lysozyme, partial [Gammaproteobacteria bacterium SHHR-1]